ncbi:hypothetical protein VP01_1074g2 [Puccinia sorghi]|uniref:Uncharacterized protein n=1 Tax=Puccinia sorghi TaxID=27349 RepID=A0A0L6VTJ2_9BASI|nr:hypothetical protein VP01_1074g2 [Puccinia sorghi]
MIRGEKKESHFPDCQQRIIRSRALRLRFSEDKIYVVNASHLTHAHIQPICKHQPMNGTYTKVRVSFQPVKKACARITGSVPRIYLWMHCNQRASPMATTLHPGRVSTRQVPMLGVLQSIFLANYAEMIFFQLLPIRVQARPGQRVLNVADSQNQRLEPFFISSTNAFFGAPGARRPLPPHNMNPTVMPRSLIQNYTTSGGTVEWNNNPDGNLFDGTGWLCERHQARNQPPQPQPEPPPTQSKETQAKEPDIRVTPSRSQQNQLDIQPPSEIRHNCGVQPVVNIHIMYIFHVSQPPETPPTTIPRGRKQKAQPSTPSEDSSIRMKNFEIRAETFLKSHRTGSGCLHTSRSRCGLEIK